MHSFVAVTSFVSLHTHRCSIEIAEPVQVWFEYMHHSIPTVLYLMEKVISCTCLCVMLLFIV